MPSLKGMDTSAPTATKNTSAFFLQAGIAFGVALLTMVVAIIYLPVDQERDLK